MGPAPLCASGLSRWKRFHVRVGSQDGSGSMGERLPGTRVRTEPGPFAWVFEFNLRWRRFVSSVSSYIVYGVGGSGVR